MKKETDDIKLFRPNDSLLYGMIRGAIGKDFVIKKYGKKRVISNTLICPTLFLLPNK